MNKTLNKVALFTDIHFGARNNSEQHNQDCIEYLKWFCDLVKKDVNIDHIIFMGDYFEQRSSISGQTLDYAYTGAKMINSLGLPVYIISGNHDLWYRQTRQIYNSRIFDSLKNFNVIGEPTIIDNLGSRGSVLFPYLFENEYSSLINYSEYPVIFGHFEFKDFVITGDTIVKEHGPDHKQFKKFKRIFSGHYHQRQIKDNVVYIGNTFPTNFADANDTERGMAIYEYKTNKLEFIDWQDAPTYIKCKLSTLLSNPKSILRPRAVVNCLVDVDLTYEESIELKASTMKKYNLRELNLDEGFDYKTALDGDMEIEDDKIDASMDFIIVDKLRTVSAKDINNDVLIELYKNLK